MAESFLERMQKSSHMAGNNVAYIESLYESFLEDPNSVGAEWREYFEKLPRVEGALKSDVPHSTVIQHFERLGRNRLKARPERESTLVQNAHEQKQMRVQDLIAAYRHRGHKKADIDPLGLMERPPAPILDLAYHHLTPADLDDTYHTGTFHYGAGAAKLAELVNALEQTYSSSIGFEYMHIVEAAEQLWVQQRIESVRAHPEYSNAQKLTILERLTAAEGLEKYLHGRYPGTKRFGLEGGESFIPMLHEMLQRLGSHGVIETVIGMAHRGRLNVLVNILGKDPWDLFDEFDGKMPDVDAEETGDVKYHQGFSTNVMTPGGEMHLALAFNPSHLEIVAPVVEGSVRARQDRREDPDGDRVVPIIVHGDAAFAGQGVVMETFQMSQTRGFKTGGTIHVIINNQVGFTTNRQDDARSTEYCTEVAKMVQAPIFHVNADDPEAVIFVTQLAADYRMEFNKDVVIDLVCYRRRGHNEAEEPMKTQPLMYQKIRSLPTTRSIYVDRLVAEGSVTTSQADDMVETYRQALENGGHVALSLVQRTGHQPVRELGQLSRPRLERSRRYHRAPRTAADTCRPARGNAGRVRAAATGQEDLRRPAQDGRWRHAGQLGFCRGHGVCHIARGRTFRVRLTGQDVGVGTFSHRHACLHHNQKDGKRHHPAPDLLTRRCRRFDLYDSLLSEEAVLAFEYGYSTTAPNTLVIWEAQFGDFANGAQVVIDQFISVPVRSKWAATLSGLTLAPPAWLRRCRGRNTPRHGWSGILQLCARAQHAGLHSLYARAGVSHAAPTGAASCPQTAGGDDSQVACCSHKLAVSTLEDLCQGARSSNVIARRRRPRTPDKRRSGLIICSGKVLLRSAGGDAVRRMLDQCRQ